MTALAAALTGWAGAVAAAQVTLDVTMLAAGSRADLVLRLADPATGWPLDGLSLRAWLRAPLAAGESCTDAVTRLATSRPDPRHALALDGFRLLILGEDGTVAGLDPRLDLASANLVHIQGLGGMPVDLLPDPPRGLLWASLGDALIRRDLAAADPDLRLPLPGRPGSLAGPGPRGEILVGLDEEGAAALLASDGAQIARQAVGQGPIDLATGAGRTLALSRGDGRLLLLEATTLERRGEVALGMPAAALALDERQDLGLVLAGSRLLVVALEVPRLLQAIELGIGADRLALTPDGRWALALDRQRSVLAVVDLARGRLAHALEFSEGAEELLVGADLLYLRLRDAPAMAILPLAALAGADPPPVEKVVMGAAATGGVGRRLMALGPSGREVWLAHPADRTAYLFTGGSMRAPVTAVPIKGVAPAGLLIQPLAPQPLGGGAYAASLRAPGAGRYALMVLPDRPPDPSCLELAVTGTSATSAVSLVAPPRLLARLAGPVDAQGAATVSLEARQGGVPAGLDGPVIVRALQMGASWQQRIEAEPTAEARWSARLRFPAAGRYLMLAEAPGAGLALADGPRLVIDVGAAP